MQAYEVDSETIPAIYATFCSVFPVVETWQTNETDLLFIGSQEPAPLDTEALRRRIGRPPFKDALAKVWRVTDLEGFLSHYVANHSFATQLTRDGKSTVNTDDRNLIEFSFARTVGKTTGFKVPELREAAHRRGEDRPLLSAGSEVNWGRVDDQNLAMDIHLGSPRPAPYSFLDETQRRRLAANSADLSGGVREALDLWRQQPRAAESLTELAVMADMLAWSGDPSALYYIQKIGEWNPGEAAMLLGFLRARQGEYAEAVTMLESAYVSCRAEPWVMALIFKNSFSIAGFLASQDATGEFGTRLYRALEKPFSVHAFDAERRNTLVTIALVDKAGFSDYSRNALASFEPDVPWNREFLQLRRDCYQALSDPRAAKANRELAQFLEAESPPLELDATPEAPRDEG